MVEKHPSSNMLHEESCSWTFTCTFTCSFTCTLTCNFTCNMCQVEAAIQSVEKLLKDYGHPPLPRKVFFIFFIKVFLRQANIFMSPKFISDTNMSATKDSCSASSVLMMSRHRVSQKNALSECCWSQSALAQSQVAGTPYVWKFFGRFLLRLSLPKTKHVHGKIKPSPPIHQ